MNVKRLVTYGGGYPFAIVATCVAVAALVPFRTLLATSLFMLLLVPLIILVARVSGVRASATAAVLAFLLLDFLFIPPYVSHQPVNLSDTEPALAIVARNDANEQEHVFLYDPSKAG